MRTLMLTLALSLSTLSASAETEEPEATETAPTQETAASEASTTEEVEATTEALAAEEVEATTGVVATEEAEPTETPASEQAEAITEVVATEEAKATEVVAAKLIAGYKKGFFLQSADGNFKLVIAGRIQPRLEVEISDLANPGATARFMVRRARIKLKGKVLGQLGFALQVGWDKGVFSLKDAYLDWNAVPKALELRVGQFKKPFDRQQLTSSSKQEFVDRALTGKAFHTGRDMGIMIHNGKKQAFEYAVAFINGTGTSTKLSGDVLVDTTTGEGSITKGSFSTLPTTFKPGVVLRVGGNAGKISGYSEADLEGGPIRFAAGASGQILFDADDTDSGKIIGEADLMMKVHGLDASAAFYVGSAQAAPSFSAQSLEAIGFRVQAGYVIGGKVQPALRYARVMPPGDGNDSDEIDFGFNVFFQKHKVKWQTDLGLLGTEDSNGITRDLRVRTQLEAGF